MTVCLQCGTDDAGDGRFCGACGRPRAAVEEELGGATTQMATAPAFEEEGPAAMPSMVTTPRIAAMPTAAPTPTPTPGLGRATEPLTVAKPAPRFEVDGRATVVLPSLSQRVAQSVPPSEGDSPRRSRGALFALLGGALVLVVGLGAALALRRARAGVPSLPSIKPGPAAPAAPTGPQSPLDGGAALATSTDAGTEIETSLEARDPAGAHHHHHHPSEAAREPIAELVVIPPVAATPPAPVDDDDKVCKGSAADGVRAVVRHHAADAAACWSQFYAGTPTLLDERVDVNLSVSHEGKAVFVHAVANTTANEKLAACFTQLVERWKFPCPTSGDVGVTYSFTLPRKR